MAQLGLLVDKSIIRAGLVELLRSQGFDDIQEAAALGELIDTNSDALPELLLVALPPRIADVSEMMSSIRGQAPLTKVVFLSNRLDINFLRECFAAGAAGYLLENISAAALQKSLTLVSMGEKVFPSELASILIDVFGQNVFRSEEIENCELSDRERKILNLLAGGHSNKVIAATLDIAESTAKLHISGILRKLHATNRTQAALRAVQHGLVTHRRAATVQGA